MVIGSFYNYRGQMAKKRAKTTSAPADIAARDTYFKKMQDFAWKALWQFQDDPKTMMIAQAYLDSAKQLGETEYAAAQAKLREEAGKHEGTMAAWAATAVLHDGEAVPDGSDADSKQCLVLCEHYAQLAQKAEADKQPDKVKEYKQKIRELAARALANTHDPAEVVKAGVAFSDAAFGQGLAPNDIVSPLKIAEKAAAYPFAQWAARYWIAIMLNNYPASRDFAKSYLSQTINGIRSGTVKSVLDGPDVDKITKVDLEYWVGHAFLRAGNYQEAMCHFATLFEVYGDVPDMKARGMYEWANTARLADPNHPEPAIAKFEEVIRDYSASFYAPLAIERMGDIYTAQGNKEKALEQYNALAERYPASKSNRCATPKRKDLAEQATAVQ